MRVRVEDVGSKRLFRCYGPEAGASKVDELELAFAAGTEYALAVVVEVDESLTLDPVLTSRDVEEVIDGVSLVLDRLT